MMDKKDSLLGQLLEELSNLMEEEVLVKKVNASFAAQMNYLKDHKDKIPNAEELAITAAGWHYDFFSKTGVAENVLSREEYISTTLRIFRGEDVEDLAKEHVAQGKVTQERYDQTFGKGA